METFEPETVRNGYCSLQLGKAVAEDGLRIALCGEGADELFAGYAPLEVAFGVSAHEGKMLRDQCIASLPVTALQRIDRGGMRHGVEMREPFLDAEVVRFALGASRDQLVKASTAGWTGKQPLREIGQRIGLPDSVIARPKTPMNEGSGLDLSQSQSPWVELADQHISDLDLRNGRKEYAQFQVDTKEELLYIHLLSSVMDIHRVPCLRARSFLSVTAQVAASLPAELQYYTMQPRP